MSDYSKITSFTPKDALVSGDPDKIVLGSELDGEFNAIQTAVATKANSADVPALSGSNSFSGTNVFSGTGIKTQGTNPIIWWSDTDAGVNEKYWSLEGNASSLTLRAYGDNLSSNNTAIEIDRTGYAVGGVTLFTAGGYVGIRSSGQVQFTNTTVSGSVTYATSPDSFQFGTSSNHNLDLFTNATTRARVKKEGGVQIVAVSVASLPSATTVGVGTSHFVTDATATTFASVVSGGGANAVPVYSDGTNWRIG